MRGRVLLMVVMDFVGGERGQCTLWELRTDGTCLSLLLVIAVEKRRLI